MKIPTFIIALAVSAMLALEGWTLVTLTNLSTKVSAIGQRLEDHISSTR